MFRNEQKASINAYIKVSKELEKGLIINCYGAKGTGKTYTITNTVSSNNYVVYMSAYQYKNPYNILTNIYKQLFNQTINKGSNIDALTYKLINKLNNKEQMILILDNMELKIKNTVWDLIDSLVNTTGSVIILIYDKAKTNDENNIIFFDEYSTDQKKKIIATHFKYTNGDIDYDKSLDDIFETILFIDYVNSYI